MTQKKSTCGGITTTKNFIHTYTCIDTHINKTVTLQIHNDCKTKQKLQCKRYMRNINSLMKLEYLELEYTIKYVNKHINIINK